MKFESNVDLFGRGTCIVDGYDLSHAIRGGFATNVRVGHVPVVVLRLDTLDARLEFEDADVRLTAEMAEFLATSAAAEPLALHAALRQAEQRIQALEEAIRATPCKGCFEAAGNSLAALRVICKDADAKGIGLSVEEVRIALRNHVHAE